jgi:hypothetical protein
VKSVRPRINAPVRVVVRLGKLTQELRAAPAVEFQCCCVVLLVVHSVWDRKRAIIVRIMPTLSALHGC